MNGRACVSFEAVGVARPYICVCRASFDESVRRVVERLRSLCCMGWTTTWTMDHETSSVCALSVLL